MLFCAFETGRCRNIHYDFSTPSANEYGQWKSCHDRKSCHDDDDDGSSCPRGGQKCSKKQFQILCADINRRSACLQRSLMSAVRHSCSDIEVPSALAGTCSMLGDSQVLILRRSVLPKRHDPQSQLRQLTTFRLAIVRLNTKCFTGSQAEPCRISREPQSSVYTMLILELQTISFWHLRCAFSRHQGHGICSLLRFSPCRSVHV